MRCATVSVLFAVLILAVFPTFSQAPAPSQTVVRDPQAIALLQASATAMGNTLPSDSVATGSVTLVAGSTTDQGTIKILTKGTSETAVQVQTTSGSNWSIIYANGQANRVDGTGNTALPLERAASSQSPYFPLAIISAALANQDACYQFVGLETLNDIPVQHVQVWNSFNSASPMKFLSAFTVTDIWLDPNSNIPLRVSFIRRDGGGSAPKIPIAIAYSNYHSVGGILYPYQIQESVNGTPWATVTIQSVAFNSGLTDSDFPVTTGVN